MPKKKRELRKADGARHAQESAKGWIKAHLRSRSFAVVEKRSCSSASREGDENESCLGDSEGSGNEAI